MTLFFGAGDRAIAQNVTLNDVRVRNKKTHPDRDGLFIGRLTVTYFSSDITCLQVSLH